MKRTIPPNFAISQNLCTISSSVAPQVNELPFEFFHIIFFIGFPFSHSFESTIADSGGFSGSCWFSQGSALAGMPIWNVH